MLINKVEIGELDIFDADVMDKIEVALEKVKKEANESLKLKAPDTIRKQCKAIFDCFNSLFGEGTDKKIFGDRVNILICLNAFAELVNEIDLQKENINKLANKYSSNRATRRAK